MSIGRLRLQTPAALKWTTAQEKSLSRDYPFQEHDPTDSALFVQRTYLHFLWLPHSIMPLALLIPSLLRVQAPPDRSQDHPHPLHASVEPLLLSLRAAASKYHNELPQILAYGSGAGEAEEMMMWYALGYEKTIVSAEGGHDPSGEDAAVFEDKCRSAWLERMEQREVQIQILLYFLKLSLPGPCTPLPPVEVLPADSVSFIPPVKPSRLRKRKKEKSMMTPSPDVRLESFMDKLSMWQLVTLMGTSRTEKAQKNSQKYERDWMQKFCEDIVEPLFKSKLPDKCALLRSKLFPNSPFPDEPASPGPSTGKSLAGACSSTHSAAMRDSRSRSRSLSVSLAQEKEKERAASVGATQDKTLQRALTRQISMSRVWKRKEQPSATVLRTDTKAAPGTAKRVVNRTDSQPFQSHVAPVITLVTATPVKAKKLSGRAKSNASGRSSSPIPLAMCRSSSSQPAERSRSSSTHSAGRSSSPHAIGRSSSPLTGHDSSFTQLDTDDEEYASASVPLCDVDMLGNDEDVGEAEEIWLPDFSPDLLLEAGARKRVPSVGLDMMAVDTPARKRMRVVR